MSRTPRWLVHPDLCQDFTAENKTRLHIPGSGDDGNLLPGTSAPVSSEVPRCSKSLKRINSSQRPWSHS
ncbi:hypothetical protein CHARACLAT_016832 [Characodon lateralis]|uniref:Uncharacterized protein n=1 Tax=Characodon lateralis TaxID=208331 RepID=A0ABU7DL90_9TELE|nr:hypothetical protein [Characodon lateralis]